VQQLNNQLQEAQRSSEEQLSQKQKQVDTLKQQRAEAIQASTQALKPKDSQVRGVMVSNLP
jgi:F0F1-type ATP synthase assembly protein I